MDAQKITTQPETIDWEARYWEWLPRVYNFFHYHTGDDALAQDLTATTFAKAWQARDRYDHDLSAFSTWLFSIAHNVAVDHFRRKRRFFSLDLARGIADDSRPLDEIVQQRRDSARLTALLDRLPARERELIALKYGAELTNRAIAGLTGMSESNVGTTLHRTVLKLRVQWDQT